MSIYLHNTMTRRKELFEPIDSNNVRMYVCGPTVYDFAHLGNARPVVVFDTLYRLLKRHYPCVTYVRNITDVDDKILAKSKATGESVKAITTRTTQAYHEDMASLNALSPDIEPRATEHITHMQAMIAKLIDSHHAYVADGNVLFHVPSMPSYGALSQHTREELIAGARIDIAPYKKDETDFVLWKPAAADQEGWDSPWGRGRPGWHIECSAMAGEHLGVTFDIHGGGLDLIFPHHENEIAQSVCAHNGAPLARYWLHNGFLVINNDKMSKSLGNIFTVRQLLSHASGEALRLALLSAHYRQPLDFSLDNLRNARAILDKWYGALRSVAGIKVDNENQNIATVDDANIVPHQVEDALADDLNTPLAIACIHEIVSSLNRANTIDEQRTLKAQLLMAGKALGLLLSDPDQWFQGAISGNDGDGTSKCSLSPEEIEAKIAARLDARHEKNWKKADAIRDELAAVGIILEDSASGTTWKRTR